VVQYRGRGVDFVGSGRNRFKPETLRVGSEPEVRRSWTGPPAGIGPSGTSTAQTGGMEGVPPDSSIGSDQIFWPIGTKSSTDQGDRQTMKRIALFFAVFVVIGAVALFAQDAGSGSAAPVAPAAPVAVGSGSGSEVAPAKVPDAFMCPGCKKLFDKAGKCDVAACKEAGLVEAWECPLCKKLFEKAGKCDNETCKAADLVRKAFEVKKDEPKKDEGSAVKPEGTKDAGSGSK
jgi:hypothetical protein